MVQPPVALPALLNSFSDAITIAAGNAHTVVLKSNGTVWAWGANHSGQLGDGTMTHHWLPIQIRGLSDVIAVEAGAYHTLALKSDGTVWAWGRNGSGQLGDGSTTNRKTPVRINHLENIRTLSADDAHTVALTHDGMVWAWGDNSGGQLGDGTTKNHGHPVRVTTLDDVRAIATGSGHTVVLKEDGTLLAFGSNAEGALGDGTLIDQKTPVQVLGLNLMQTFYTVTATAGTNGTITPASQSVISGKTTTFTVTPQVGYAIATVTGCKGRLIGAIYTTGPITEQCAVNATFRWDGSYTVSTTVGINGSMNPTSRVVVSGATTTFIVNPKEGYEGMLVGCGGKLFGNTYKTGVIQANCTITATFKLKRYTVTATAGANGTISLPLSRIVNHGATTTFVVKPKVGYEIASVTGCKGALSGATYKTGAVTAMCTVAATFKRRTYSVMATAGANGSITPASRIVDHGATTTFTITPEVGYNAVISGDCPAGKQVGNLYTTGVITAKCTINVIFSKHTHTIIGTAGTYGSIAPLTQNAIEGTTAILTVTPNTGYTASVRGCGGNLSGNTYTTGVITDDCTVIASFIQKTYTVSATAGNGGAINPSSQIVNYGSTTSFTVTPNSGYTATVSGCNGTLLGNTYTTGSITGNCTIIASFIQKTYTVSATAGNGGSINPSSQIVNHGSTTSFTVTPNSGYTATVSGCNGTLSGNTYTTGSITGNCTVIASFSQQTQTYTVTATAIGIGTVTPASQTVSDGATATFTFTINSGYTSYSIAPTGCGGGTFSGDIHTYTTNPITANCTLNVTFAATYPLTLTMTGTGSGTVSSSYSGSYYTAGETVNLTATPASGSTFTGWSPSPCAASFTMPANALTCTATFTASGTATVTPAVAGNYGGTVALKSDGTVWAWGRNYQGEVGDGTTVDRYVPVPVSTLTNVTRIATGISASHSFAIKQDGTVWAWGQNSRGQFGNGTTTYSSTPVQALISDVTAIATGGNFSVGLKGDGTVWTWGRNLDGQLCDGSNTDRSVPAQVTSVSGIIAIAAGDRHTMMVKNDGTVWACGYNASGQLGNGTTDSSNTPVSHSTDVIAIAAGVNHTVAVKSDGTVWAWGANNNYQLGDGTNTNSLAPVQVHGPDNVGFLGNITKVSAGEDFTITFKIDGTLWAWGRNYAGQVGDGTATFRSAPVQVITLSGVTAFAAGVSHGAAVKSDGTVWTWGDNTYGKLGNNTTSSSATPLQPLGTDGTGVLYLKPF